ncbi:2-phosphosulfolactate phosphatase family protein [Trichothermofontia sichuanensis B231]|uniref:2-phosphosulfolactate phosphatase family protein n=1 Tax=Trichothermofontia sichuanensis TaxID=3045816 RepID=UPI002246ACA1|nr:2-phosphosulfolactate phosphatase family protein [Trichothermofontia sichuanensis]UZQ55882.1 2-phosphosulfolactate phosphatase family protein [Trichothermofontia sichuanensis B231]
MKLFVYHTPELTPTDTVPDCAIVVDVLRATTTIAAALAAGAEAVQAFSDLDTLMAASERWPVEKRLRAGERGGAKVDGCDLGNSPLDCTPDVVQGRRLFISTTNGTRALQRVATVPIVITATLVNRRAVVSYVSQQQPETIWILGSGWEGSFSLEDTACAGALLQLLCDQHWGGQLPSDAIGNDEVIGAIALFQQWQSRLLELFHHASHGQRLLRLNGDADLAYCAQLDTLDVVPIQKEPGVLVRY